jgi:hypothetical protein
MPTRREFLAGAASGLATTVASLSVLGSESVVAQPANAGFVADWDAGQLVAIGSL